MFKSEELWYCGEHKDIHISDQISGPPQKDEEYFTLFLHVNLQCGQRKSEQSKRQELRSQLLLYFT